MSSIYCEDLAEFAKSQGHKPDSEFEENSQFSLLTEKCYKDSTEHLCEELAWLGLLIWHFLEKSKVEAGQGSQDFVCLFISEVEANSILQAVCCGSKSFRSQGLCT